jgi:adenosylcobinamide-GDP ribazoletransferase
VTAAPAGSSWFGARLTELVLAFALLTRLPCPRITPARLVATGEYVWAFPIVGFVVGTLSALALWLASSLGAGPSVAALAALSTSLLATGVLHEDGLADFWDGLGGGRTRARKLEIMRDSAIGSYGAAALFIGLALRWTALAGLANPMHAAVALNLAHTLSRAMLALVLEFGRPARKDGLAAATGGSWVGSAASVLVAAAIALLYADPNLALAALLAAAAGVGGIAALAARYLGGYTGDVLGAAEQTAEALVLVVAAGLLSR